MARRCVSETHGSDEPVSPAPLFNLHAKERRPAAALRAPRPVLHHRCFMAGVTSIAAANSPNTARQSTGYAASGLAVSINCWKASFAADLGTSTSSDTNFPPSPYRTGTKIAPTRNVVRGAIRKSRSSAKTCAVVLILTAGLAQALGVNCTRNERLGLRR